jgi:cell division protein FtsB
VREDPVNKEAEAILNAVKGAHRGRQDTELGRLVAAEDAELAEIHEARQRAERRIARLQDKIAEYEGRP